MYNKCECISCLVYACTHACVMSVSVMDPPVVRRREEQVTRRDLHVPHDVVMPTILARTRARGRRGGGRGRGRGGGVYSPQLNKLISST